jgi:hypothetical protein
VARRRIEVGVPAAGVDRAMSETQISQSCGLVRSDRYVASDVGHEVVDACVPTQGELRNNIGEAPCGIAEAVGPHEGDAGVERFPDNVPASEALVTP